MSSLHAILGANLTSRQLPAQGVPVLGSTLGLKKTLAERCHLGIGKL
jgi:hypothetical protein